MAENTSIEWCDHTFNPWRGCTKVSPGCAHCYAETLSKRNPAVLGVWGKGQPRVRASAAMWRQPFRWSADAGTALRDGDLDRKPRVFCASLADWLDHEVPVEWLADLLDLIRRTPNLNWLLLTKRPQNWYSRITAALWHVEGLLADCDGSNVFPKTDLGQWLNEWTRTDGEGVPANVWIGTTVEDQARADERIPILLSIPAKVRFLSCEPLLGPVNLTNGLGLMGCPGDVDWVICGGESGPGARPMHPDWARSLRDQCQDAGVAFLFKQWGEAVPGENLTGGESAIVGTCCLHQDGHIDTADCVSFRYEDTTPADGAVRMHRVCKKAAGRLLDGREHNEFPQPVTA